MRFKLSAFFFHDIILRRLFSFNLEFYFCDPVFSNIYLHFSCLAAIDIFSLGFINHDFKLCLEFEFTIKAVEDF